MAWQEDTRRFVSKTIRQQANCHLLCAGFAGPLSESCVCACFSQTGVNLRSFRSRIRAPINGFILFLREKTCMKREGLYVGGHGARPEAE